jgi:hypothetical protein
MVVHFAMTTGGSSCRQPTSKLLVVYVNESLRFVVLSRLAGCRDLAPGTPTRLGERLSWAEAVYLAIWSSLTDFLAFGIAKSK